MENLNALWLDLPADEMNVAAEFRLTTDIPPCGATLRVAAADFYRLWVDGRLAAHGPARAPHGHARVDEIPLGAGSGVTLVVEVHSVNVPCFDDVFQNAFFAAELVAADGRALAGTADFEAWRDETLVQKVRRYSYQRGFLESRRMAEDPAGFRRGGPAPAGYARAAMAPRPMPRLLPRGVNYPRLAFHDAGAPVGRGSVTFDMAAASRNTREVFLVGRNGFRGFLPGEWEDDSALDAARLVWSGSGTGADLYDFGRTITGFFSLRVRADSPGGATVLVVFDEVRAPEGAPFPVDPLRGTWTRVLKWRLAPGEYDLLALHPSSARFAAVVVTEGSADTLGFGMVDYENPDKSAAAIPPTGDATLDKIIAAARETFAQNAVDVLTDCPSRERAGWMFDAFFTGRAEALFTGRNLVERALLEDYSLCPQLDALPEGMVPMLYPGEALQGEFIPNWSLWWVLELRQYLERTGDAGVAEASRPAIERLLGWFKKFENADGLLENLGGWVFVEWSACNDKDHVAGVNFPTNFLYASALEAAGRLLGRDDLASRGAAVRDAAARLAWNGEWFEDNAVRDESGALRLQGHVTETGQYYAFYFGGATPASHPDLWGRLVSEFGPRRAAAAYPDITPSNAIPGAYMRLELLLRDGRRAQVLEECRDFFAPMADLTGTLWEHLSMNASMDHGFASSAAWLIVEALKKPLATRGGLS
ncbi:MAG: hypothetical protein IKH04_11645 [Kiritimatiellae bacterium]|nr:hypothetical protein [Kiritimatiellia bacterium]